MTKTKAMAVLLVKMPHMSHGKTHAIGGTWSTKVEPKKF